MKKLIEVDIKKDTIVKVGMVRYNKDLIVTLCTRTLTLTLLVKF